MRTVYVAEQRNPQRGIAFSVTDESPVDDSSSLEQVLRLAIKKLGGRKPHSGMPSWWLGPWYQCDRCAGKFLEWVDRPASNAGISRSYTNPNIQNCIVRWYCPKCHKDIKTDYEHERNRQMGVICAQKRSGGQ